MAIGNFFEVKAAKLFKTDDGQTGVKGVKLADLNTGSGINGQE